jgi:hypothetical protein
MPSKYQHPSLNLDGWTNSSIQVADQMLSDFFLSEYDQTATWPDKVSSFPWFLQQYADDLSAMAAAIQDALLKYFSNQFQQVEVEVLSEPLPDSINQHSLIFYLVFTDSSGEQFNLSKLLRYDNTKITEITNILQTA